MHGVTCGSPCVHALGARRRCDELMESKEEGVSRPATAPGTACVDTPMYACYMSCKLKSDHLTEALHVACGATVHGRNSTYAHAPVPCPCTHAAGECEVGPCKDGAQTFLICSS